MDDRARRKFQLESLLHQVDGRLKLEALYRAAISHGRYGVIHVRPRDLPLRAIIECILDAEFPPEQSASA